MLYEYIEKYDKELFGEIQKLAERGKWKIIGGWYVQPDCLVPSGESFIRQITTGREYFAEKFNARPTAALNFDSFGHTKGLPQILKKCDYDSYVFCRPMPWLHPLEKEDLPHGPFLWKGYDGSAVKALRFEDETIYCSQYGYAKENIIRKEKHYEDQDDILILWGVGNHGGAFALNVLNDNGDPWGWRIKKLGESPVLYDNLPEDKWVYTESEYKQMLPDLSKRGVFENLESVTVVEKGELLTEVQSLFSLGESHAVINYKIYKDTPYADVNIHVLWNETYKALKLALPVKGEKYFAQMAFGVEEYLANGYEYPCNRYVGVKCGDKALVVYNNSGVHSSSKEDDNLYLTLLNGSAYCAHPTDDSHSLIPDETRYVENIEQGSHDFSFRIMVNDTAECKRFANEFNQKPYALSFFPHGNGNNKNEAVVLSNPNIVISAFKRLNDGKYLIRLYNGRHGNAETNLAICGRKIKIEFADFEFKTFVFDGKDIKESELSDLY